MRLIGIFRGVMTLILVYVFASGLASATVADQFTKSFNEQFAANNLNAVASTDGSEITVTMVMDSPAEFSLFAKLLIGWLSPQPEPPAGRIGINPQPEPPGDKDWLTPSSSMEPLPQESSMDPLPVDGAIGSPKTGIMTKGIILQ
jgi:hypothetical protein